jgi:hypothetical protein
LEKSKIIEKMFTYLEENHKSNIHKGAFSDISNVFLNLIDEYNVQLKQFKESRNNNEIKQNKKVQWVCNAAPGHGKTTVLICFLKWLVTEPDEYKRVPILLVIRENEMARQIYHDLDRFRRLNEQS